ncbi:MAG: hypothetical protein RL417_2188 [Pseudomonadota bacterium]|jgi:acetoin utilization protein AcuB
MVVHQIMTREPEYIETKQTLRDAVNKFRELKIRHLPVVREGDLIGMVSDRDIAGFARGLDIFAPTELEAALDRPVGDFMQGDVVSVDEDTDVGEVIDTMIDQRIGAIPVVDAHSGRLSGIVSYVDILKAARGVL